MSEYTRSRVKGKYNNPAATKTIPVKSSIAKSLPGIFALQYLHLPLRTKKEKRGMRSSGPSR